MKCTWIVLVQLFVTVEGWSCVSTVAKFFSRVNTDAVLRFDISADIKDSVNSYTVRFHNNYVQARVTYNNGAITTEKIPGVDITAELSGNVVLTLSNVGPDNAGIYYINSPSTSNRCSCLYILGSPIKPLVSVNKSPSDGDSATLSCTSTSTTTPSNHSLGFIYSWRVDGTDNPAGSKYSYSTNRHTLTVSNIVKDDANKQFTCSTKEDVSDGYTSSRSDSLSLDVLYGPDSVEFHPSPIYYEMPENTDLHPVTCTADCNPKCSFKWSKVGKGAAVSNNAVLGLGMLSRSKAGTYRCTATGFNGSSMTNDLTVSVIYTTLQSFYIEGHLGQNNVTVDEHDVKIHFECTVDSNTASTIRIQFEGEVLKEQINKTSLSLFQHDIACFDAGVYICAGSNGYGQTSSNNVTLFVNCSPRPIRQIQGNITSYPHVPVTLSVTAIAYPEPGPKGFGWHKQEGVGWLPLLSNEDLTISSSGLQSNLTLLNVSRVNYGKYRVTVTNTIGTYEQHLFLSEKKDSHDTDRKVCSTPSDNTALIVGLTLGALCCVLAIYATYLFISKNRIISKGIMSMNRSAKQTIYVNASFASDVTERQTHDGVTTGEEEASVQQYTELSRYANTDRDTYDVINKT